MNLPSAIKGWKSTTMKTLKFINLKKNSMLRFNFTFAFFLIFSIAYSLAWSIPDRICRDNDPYMSQSDCLKITNFILKGDFKGLHLFLEEFKDRLKAHVAKRQKLCMRVVGNRAVCHGYGSRGIAKIFRRHVMLAEITHQAERMGTSLFK